MNVFFDLGYAQIYMCVLRNSVYEMYSNLIVCAYYVRYDTHIYLFNFYIIWVENSTLHWIHKIRNSGHDELAVYLLEWQNWKNAGRRWMQERPTGFLWLLYPHNKNECQYTGVGHVYILLRKGFIMDPR